MNNKPLNKLERTTTLITGSFMGPLDVDSIVGLDGMGVFRSIFAGSNGLVFLLAPETLWGLSREFRRDEANLFNLFF